MWLAKVAKLKITENESGQLFMTKSFLKKLKMIAFMMRELLQRIYDICLLNLIHLVIKLAVQTWINFYKPLELFPFD